MGCVATSSADPIVQQQLNADRIIQSKFKQLLILGTKGSGKNTLCKQLRIIYGNGFNDDQREELKDQIYVQILQQMTEISHCIQSLREHSDHKDDNELEEYSLSEKGISYNLILR